ncbi:MAG TPA: ABC transporter ATP-binding protein [Candidatus Methylacidiphilales bacterium]|jgi:lipopolysaccharide transport system ATP-binding protein|nr:ABC transporter ATP-binding protein [Candidatus Methylacidiphilales bacterium]
MNVAIRVENLSKKYVLRHQLAGRSRYVALRDVLTHKAASLFSRKPESSGKREDFWALKDVSFEIKEGDAIGIIGRNGAGKSTLLKLLSRITVPTTGRIEIEGRIASLLEVGTGFHPELTGRENIYLNGAILGMQRAEIKKRFDEIVAFAEVEKFLDTPVKHFSSGMYMRLAFAVAAHLESEILIVDEVLAVGDAAFQKKCLGKMRDVGQSGRTVLFVSHNMEALVRICPRCIYLVKGRMEMMDETRHVIAEYSANFKHAAGEIDLSTLPRRFEGNGNARMLRLRSLQEGENAGSWCYEYGAPLGFAVEFEVHRPIEEPIIGYSFFSTTGMELVSTTTLQERPLDRLAPGRYQLRMIIPDSSLNPGTYMLALGIATLGRSVDHILDATQIEIVPNKLSVQKGIDKIWAPVTPHTVFELIGP